MRAYAAVGYLDFSVLTKLAYFTLHPYLRGIMAYLDIWIFVLSTLDEELAKSLISSGTFCKNCGLLFIVNCDSKGVPRLTGLTQMNVEVWPFDQRSCSLAIPSIKRSAMQCIFFCYQTSNEQCVTLIFDCRMCEFDIQLTRSPVTRLKLAQFV